VGIAYHHCKPSAPATAGEFSHSSTGWAVPEALKESKSSKYLFFVAEGCIHSLDTTSDSKHQGLQPNLALVPMYSACNSLPTPFVEYLLLSESILEATQLSKSMLTYVVDEVLNHAKSVSWTAENHIQHTHSNVIDDRVITKPVVLVEHHVPMYSCHADSWSMIFITNVVVKSTNDAIKERNYLM
jgi:hypothetical protein